MRALAFFLSLLAATTPPATTSPRKWNDTTRDVYVGGKLDRNVQTLVAADSPRIYAVLCGDEVLILDPEKQEVARAPRSAFTLSADRTTATTEGELTRERVGALLHPDSSTYLADNDGKAMLIASHQSKAGPMTIDELWATVPVWRAIAEQYEPGEAVVARLRAIKEPTRLQVVMATWCGDSKQYVPRLLKSVEKAANPNLTVEITGVGPEFLSPMDLIVRENITNVPTVIVRRNEKEIGRFVETPATSTVEEDIAGILEGTPRAHPSRYERGIQRANGTYELRDRRGNPLGNETFELYDGLTGGIVVHSVLKKTDVTIETWAGLNKEWSPRFAEVTYRGDGKTTRARYRADGDKWVAWSRGTTGIIEQTLPLPQNFTVVAPATATFGWPMFHAGRGAATSAYFIPESPRNGIGATTVVAVRSRGSKMYRFPNAPRRLDGESVDVTLPDREVPMRMVVHSSYFVPAVVSFADGSERRLTQFAGDLPSGRLLAK
ncbi:MAG TPA: thioredoxin family protein [Thermoanaerobaculia bacterium]|nr:thioredoxin family protein [Thermoanaerobaculia bacterium]